MEFIIKIGQFLLSLSLLIVLHELGHFIPAKLFKTRVEKFYLFFDVKFSLFKKKIGDTVYGIGWLPLGGYVKISGMIDESMDKEQMALPPQPWEFRSKPAWQRLIIMLGGVTVNFVLALLIYIVASWAYGDADISTDSIKEGYTVQNPLLTKLGFETGDDVVRIDDKEITKYSEIKGNIIGAKSVTVERNGEQKTIALPEDFLGQLSTSDDRDLFELRIPFVVVKVPDSSLNKNSGLKEGDIIRTLDGKDAEYTDQVVSIAKDSKNQTIKADVLRNGELESLELKINDKGELGVVQGVTYKSMEELGYLKVVRNEYSFSESFGVGLDKFTSQITGYFGQLKQIFSPSTGAYKGVGGFKAIYDVFPDTWSWPAFWSITAFLSIMLGVLNLLPIPALDGGHVMFLLYEMISGRKPGDKFMEYAQMVGFFILIALVLFANGNDIFKALFN
ncbi:RIP metalloprotease RseP [Aurantibacter aestuarii]|uniref:Zinc metalloprotease n=1 Tax=Aurantibacter aestuarii TaxID=1266046 RepID=A0A2T1NDC3_9FLAO|nr:RIP metalloprotease RseP [Aurantibacter aestuarii]PSG90443.1 RIP metalloprotease RseP [Aurantibacter aestuarii]